MADDEKQMIDASIALNKIRAQIGNRQSERHQLFEKLNAIDGELRGLREAEHQIAGLAAST